jgi:site-specific DNA-methyltransferase (adenine-specific)
MKRWLNYFLSVLKNVIRKNGSAASMFDIRHGDCVVGMAALDPASVDVVVTSPPYNLGKEYTTYDDDRPPEQYLQWCEDWAAQISRVLKEDGSLFLNLGASSSNLLFPFEVARKVAKSGLTLQNTIHWIKSISIDRGANTKSYGHFKPKNSARYLNDCQEYVFHFTRQGRTELDRLAIGVPYVHKSNIKRWFHTNGKDKRCRGNTWFIPYKTIHQRAKQRPHPATFPTELAAKCIKLHGKKNAVVMDPFLGIGHSAFAARDCAGTVSKFYGFDIDEEYLKVCSQILGCEYTEVQDAAAAGSKRP